MNALIQEIQTSLLDLLGSGIKALPGVIIAIILLLITRRIANSVRRLVNRALTRVVHSASLRSLIVQLTFILVWIVGILAAGVTAFPSLQLGDILALFGLTSVAVGLIFQETGKNFIAGTLLLLHEPFQINDQIAVEGIEGTVEEIGFRTTQILTYQGERVLLPNAILFSQPVRVLTALPHRRTDLKLQVDYSTSLAEVTELLLQTLKQVDGILMEPAPLVDAYDFGEYAIELVVRYWTLPQQYEVLRIRSRVIHAIQYAFKQAGITIPYPVSTHFLVNQPMFNDRSGFG